jgi:hypothetical protein
MAGFQGLTFVVQPVVSAAGVLNASIVAGTSRVAGILDPAGGINRMYNPTSVGFSPLGGTDTAATWLPIVTSISASSVNDQYWAPTFQSGGQTGATVVNPNTKVGQVQLLLTAATADTVRASSVMQFKLSPNAFVIVATGTF